MFIKNCNNVFTFVQRVESGPLDGRTIQQAVFKNGKSIDIWRTTVLNSNGPQCCRYIMRFHTIKVLPHQCAVYFFDYNGAALRLAELICQTQSHVTTSSAQNIRDYSGFEGVCNVAGEDISNARRRMSTHNWTIASSKLRPSCIRRVRTTSKWRIVLSAALKVSFESLISNYLVHYSIEKVKPRLDFNGCNPHK